MKPTVHILATVRKPELLEAALLVFKTLRTGFPDAPVMVWGNGLSLSHENILLAAAQSVGANFANITTTSHDAWIESLILESLHPFWICDTDIVFWSDISRLKTQDALAFSGRFEPRFQEPWTDTLRAERLHTCLMYINPANTRAAVRQFMSSIPAPFGHTAEYPLIRQNFIPVRDPNGGPVLKPIFYDTMTGLYQAGFGTPFTEAQNDCFDHLNCGTYADLISPALAGHLDGPALSEQHQMVYANPALLRGARHSQAKFYERHQWPCDVRPKKKGPKCLTHPE